MQNKSDVPNHQPDMETCGKDMGKHVGKIWGKLFQYFIGKLWDGGFLQLGWPSSHPFLDRIFHEINYPASLGYPH